MLLLFFHKEEPMRETVLEVDKTKFLNNIDKIKEKANGKILMPVIKANAYGTYLNYCLDITNLFDIVCVATVDEVSYIRKTGYKKEILILNQPCPHEIPNINAYKASVGICDKDFLEAAIENGKKIKVHLELETGMNRTGIKEDELEWFIEKIKASENIIVEGVYTHFSSADDDPEYTDRQFEIFKRGVKRIQESFDTIKYIHSSASTGITHLKEDITNSVRPGIIMYGYYPSKNEMDLIDIEPTCKLKASISHIFWIDEGESVSYNRRFTSKRRTKVATVQIGYADGLRRALLGKGEVIIHGQKAPIIGTICMDSCMVDITDIKDDIKVGDKVYIWDNEIITLEEIADKCGTINYEILCTISSRVVRRYNE